MTHKSSANKNAANEQPDGLAAMGGFVECPPDFFLMPCKLHRGDNFFPRRGRHIR